MSGKCHEKLYRIGQAEKRLILGWVSFGEQIRVSFPERQGKGCKSIIIEDPYIRMPHQIQNLVRFSEILTRFETIKELNLITGFDNDAQKAEAEEKFEMLQDSLYHHGIVFKWSFSPVIHDRAVKLDNGWIIKIGRGLDFYQKPDNWFSIGSSDFEVRPCLETTIDIFQSEKL